jgi:hypothetical protein
MVTQSRARKSQPAGAPADERFERLRTDSIEAMKPESPFALSVGAKR